MWTQIENDIALFNIIFSEITPCWYVVTMEYEEGRGLWFNLRKKIKNNPNRLLESGMSFESTLAEFHKIIDWKRPQKE